jgi:hypothetical protein
MVGRGKEHLKGGDVGRMMLVIEGSQKLKDRRIGAKLNKAPQAHGPSPGPDK